MDKNIIIHVSEVNISHESGLGRVEYHWKEAFEEAQFTFLHIGPKEVGKLKHNFLFPGKAYKYFQSLNIIPKAFIVHEPASGYFVNKGIPCFVESHGIERRFWEAQLNGLIPYSLKNPISLKTKLLFPLWRLYNCDKGLKHATKLLLINSDDKDYVKKKYRRKDQDIMMFENGVYEHSLPDVAPEKPFTVLFNGGWLERKGVFTLMDAAQILFKKGLAIEYLLIGTGKDVEKISSDWPEHLRQFVKIIPRFPAGDEACYLASSSLSILPSYFEGQPLSLLQAMAAGKCCITTNCCGQKDIIENLKTGLLFKPGDSVELAALIDYCFNNREIMDEIGNNARNQVKNRSWSDVSKNVVEYITNNI